MRHTQGGSAAGYFEPTLTHQFLPRCPNCGDRHPLAYRPARAADTCPSCGGPSGEPGPIVTVPAAISGGGAAGAIARFFLAAGEALAKLERRLRS